MFLFSFEMNKKKKMEMRKNWIAAIFGWIASRAYDDVDDVSMSYATGSEEMLMRGCGVMKGNCRKNQEVEKHTEKETVE